MGSNEANKLVKGALLLALAGLVSKILSAGYRIPLQNLAGDIGYYVYQQVYPVLGMATVLALYGFPSAISKMAADLKGEGKTLTMANFYLPLFLLLIMINGIPFLFLRFHAHAFALWVGDANLSGTYKVAAFIFLLIPFTALLRGAFQGSQNMKPTALSQIAEQIVRVFIIIAAAVIVSGNSGQMYSIGRAAGIAAILGALAAIAVLGIFAFKKRPSLTGKAAAPPPWKYYLKTLLLFGIVAALNHMILLIIQFADTLTLIPGLIEHGATMEEAMALKGVFDRGQPLIQLGTVLGSSFALALVPTASKQKLEANPDLFYFYIRTSLMFGFYLAFGATIGLIQILPEANLLLFKNSDGTGSLQILAIAALLSSMAITSASILQGIGYLKRTAAYIFAVFFLKWMLNHILVPYRGIDGGAIATVIALSVLCALSLLALNRKLPQLAFLRSLSLSALLKASGAMIVSIIAIHFLMPGIETLSRTALFAWVGFTVIFGGCLYLIILIRSGAFTIKQLAMLPFAMLWLRICKEGKNDAV